VKKLIALAVVAMIVGSSLVGCGGSGTGTGKTEKTVTETKKTSP
jgi:hypothetical protein